MQHIVSGCKQYIDHGRYNWRHDSVLICLSNSLSHLTDWSIYVDLPSFPSPSWTSNDILRPGLILHNKDSNKIHIMELTVGFENNLKINSDHKLSQYRPLHTSLSTPYQKVNFINMFMSVSGVLENSCISLFKLLKDLDLPEQH